ncbi:MAG: hypothetical protein JOZ90_12750 [Alphaproteobacteria bacterium]|nr:hypothetical protein [Alphaproteobacteria bacterium]MBV9371961.1 hypothetical protein [Alphaproteobacteria bacterium]MBV9901944.1 hypothetical protein [Alphaproteobacteria bacterium]
MFFFNQDFTHLAAATVAALVLGYLLSWGLDRLVLGRMIEDDVTAMAIGSVLAFLILMLAATLFLTASLSSSGGSLVIPPVGYAIAFVLGTAAAAALRMKLEASDDD